MEADYRREAMGAFAHEVRTPLTSIRMVMELARRQSSAGQLVLDAELAEMLAASVTDLQTLADDLQEASRLERGKVALSDGPAELSATVEAACALMRPAIQLAVVECPVLEGPWDPARLVRALAGFGEAANRMGNGSGQVRFDCQRAVQQVRLRFESGTPGGARKAVAADAGFGFFRARAFVLASGGSVDCERSERYAKMTVTLPLRSGSAN